MKNIAAVSLVTLLASCNGEFEVSDGSDYQTLEARADAWAEKIGIEERREQSRQRERQASLIASGDSRTVLDRLEPMVVDACEGFEGKSKVLRLLRSDEFRHEVQKENVRSFVIDVSPTGRDHEDATGRVSFSFEYDKGQTAVHRYYFDPVRIDADVRPLLPDYGHVESFVRFERLPRGWKPYHRRVARDAVVHDIGTVLRKGRTSISVRVQAVPVLSY